MKGKKNKVNQYQQVNHDNNATHGAHLNRQIEPCLPKVTMNKNSNADKIIIDPVFGPITIDQHDKAEFLIWGFLTHHGGK